MDYSYIYDDTTVKPKTLWSYFHAHIFVAIDCIDLGSSGLSLELKNWQLYFFALNDLLVTFSFDFQEILEMTTSLHINQQVYTKTNRKICLITVPPVFLICIACNGSYSGWVPSPYPILKPRHQNLTFDISSSCVKFHKQVINSYGDIYMKVTSQSFWFHCSNPTWHT